MRSLLAGAAVLVLLLTPSARAAPDVVALRWRPGAGGVERRTTRMIISGSGQSATTVAYELLVTRERDGAEWRYTFAGPREAPGDGVPRLWVSETGKLLRVDAARASADRWVLTFVEGELREGWELVEGFWTGRELEVGRWYDGTLEASAPADRGLRIAYDARHRLEARVPCDARDLQQSCVRVAIHATARPEAAQAAVASLRASRQGSFGADEEVTWSGTRELTGVLDLRTLARVRLASTETATMTARKADGTERALEITVRTLTTSEMTEEWPAQRASPGGGAQPRQ